MNNATHSFLRKDFRKNRVLELIGITLHIESSQGKDIRSMYIIKL